MSRVKKTRIGLAVFAVLVSVFSTGYGMWTHNILAAEGWFCTACFNAGFLSELVMGEGK